MLIDLLMILVGLVCLILGGDVLVRGASALALRLSIPAVIVSLTIVAFGTSAPELLIGIEAALDDVPELALGNVVGSNTANILLVLGVPAILTGLAVRETETHKNYYYMLGATALFVALAATGVFVWWHGLILLTGLAMMLFMSYRASRNVPDVELSETEEMGDPDMPLWRMGAYILGGLILLPVGADFLVEGSIEISRAFKVPEAIIGLTIVALGTSLPELATTVAAGYRKEGDIAVGNVIGSNMFNLLGILGVTSLIAPVPVPRAFFQFDLIVMVGASLVLIPVLLGWVKLGRWAGVALVSLYVIYILTLLG